MAKKSIEETYGKDVAAVMEEGKRLGQPMDENNAISIADQKAKEQAKKPVSIAPRSFSPEKEFLTNTDGKYFGQFEFEDGRYFTVIQTPKGFVATTPTNSGNVINSSYFENIDDLYEDLLYQGEGDKLSSIANNSNKKDK